MISYEDLEKRWGVRRGTLRTWVHRGKLPPPDSRVGREPVWHSDTIEQVEQDLGLGADRISEVQ